MIEVDRRSPSFRNAIQAQQEQASVNLPEQRAWLDDPTRTGVVIAAQVENAHRPAWAAAILKACCDRAEKVPDEIKRVLEIAADRSRWAEGRDAFSAVRLQTLAAEKSHPPVLRHFLLFVAENTARILYNASSPADPFQEDSGALLVRCSGEFTLALADPEFTSQIWQLVTQPSGSTD